MRSPGCVAQRGCEVTETASLLKKFQALVCAVGARQLVSSARVAMHHAMTMHMHRHGTSAIILARMHMHMHGTYRAPEGSSRGRSCTRRQICRVWSVRCCMLRPHESDDTHACSVVAFPSYGAISWGARFRGPVGIRGTGRPVPHDHEVHMISYKYATSTSHRGISIYLHMTDHI